MMAIKRYSKKEPQVFAWVFLPYIFFLNLIVFGDCMFTSAVVFARCMLYGVVYIALLYFLFGLVAIYIQKRFPLAGQMFQRISTILPVFYVMNGCAMTLFFQVHDQLRLFGCIPRTGMLGWAIAYGCLMSTLITLFNEGLANWEAWKTSITETDRLKNSYQRSKVLGLRGQINPHFLFNCFNTLSGLIQEDEEKAERFLDDMTIVHRYLLSGDDELLVSVAMEQRFARSYLQLAKERFGKALDFTINTDEHAPDRTLPPLSLQVILENIIYTNTLSKSHPLRINIAARAAALTVSHSINRKTIVQDYALDAGLDNLVDKYRMLGNSELTIREDDRSRTIILPLFAKKGGCRMSVRKTPIIYRDGVYLAMPLVAFSILYLLFGNRLEHEWKLWVIGLPLLIIIGVLFWKTHLRYNDFLRQKFPGQQQTATRVLFTLLANIFVATPAFLLVFVLFDKTSFMGYSLKNNDIRYGYILVFCINLVFETVWELVYIIRSYRDSIAEQEQLEQMKLNQEFEGLKEKVNPHFLFNCFNTLSSLIAEDKDRAEQFLDELSKVYRYLLRNNQDGLTTVESELKFVESYFGLLQTRHGSSIQLQIETDKKYNNYLLPSLSLQLLIENCVKHNAVSKDRPLVIDIFTTTGSKLVVNNNLQRKTVKVPGNSIGLKNIREKYELLEQPGFRVLEDDKNFTVILPLVWKPIETTNSNAIPERGVSEK